jgi:hypothetical protein
MFLFGRLFFRTFYKTFWIPFYDILSKNVVAHRIKKLCESVGTTRPVTLLLFCVEKREHALNTMVLMKHGAIAYRQQLGDFQQNAHDEIRLVLRYGLSSVRVAHSFRLLPFPPAVDKEHAPPGVSQSPHCHGCPRHDAPSAALPG